MRNFWLDMTVGFRETRSSRVKVADAREGGAIRYR
jgi:hypothetical protein